MDAQNTQTALAPREETASPLIEQLSRGVVRTPAEFAERLRQAADVAFILSPTTAVSMIAPGYEIVPVVVAIDPSVDAESGRGNEVYHQRSIHKGHYKDAGRGQKKSYEPVEVSLNKYGLLRILSAYGVNVHPTQWIKDGSAPDKYLWIAMVSGDIREFDGGLRQVPPGTGSLDAQDGAADIGEWTPTEWAKRVEVADAQKKKTPADDQWKCKPEPIGGWTYERVIQVRRYGRQLAETKALNRLARNLGIRQSYTIADLKRKPFIIMRPVFMPDMTDPEIRKMVTAANLGARAALYPGAGVVAAQSEPIGAISYAAGEMGGTLDGTLEPEEPERMTTATPPSDAEEVSFDEARKVEQTPIESYVVTKVLQRGKEADARWFAQTREEVTLYTPEIALARVLSTAAKDGQPRTIPTERVVVDGQPYRQVIEITLAHGLKL